MLARLFTVAVLVLGVTVADSLARNPAYYGTRPGMSARMYSGEYQANRPNIVPTFSLPVYGGGFRSYYRGGYYPGSVYYQQPVLIYPPRVTYYGYGF